MVVLIVFLLFILTIHFWLKWRQKRIETYHKYEKRYPHAIRKYDNEAYAEKKYNEDRMIHVSGISESLLTIEEGRIVNEQFKLYIESNPQRLHFYRSFAEDDLRSSVFSKEGDFNEKIQRYRELLFKLNHKQYAVLNINKLDNYIEEIVLTKYESLKQNYSNELELYISKHKNYSKYQIIVHEDEIKSLRESF